MSNPFKAVLDIRRHELPLALLMFGYFFLVITSFWILKPIKKALFIQYYDAAGLTLQSWHMTASQAELVAKVLNMIVAIFAVIIFTWLSRHFRRQQLTYCFSAFFLAGFAVYAGAIAAPGAVTVWTFYLFGDLYSTLMVATFFVFLNDSVTAAEAKRLYGLIGLGGVAGGVFGTSAVRLWIDSMASSDWLWVCLAVAIVIMLIAMTAGRLINSRREAAADLPSIEQGKHGNPAVEGAALVMRSRYLLAIAGVVGLYEIVSTLLDFQFTATVSHFLDGAAIGRQFSLVFAVTNWVSMIVQLFLTSFVMTRFGLTTALMVLPVAMLAGSTGFLLFPVLWVGSSLNTLDNGFSYSINQSSKETLYVPTTVDEKYKAKAFIDMFVQRFAKALAVGVSLAVTTIFVDFDSIRYLSLLTAVLVVLWLWSVRYAGRRFDELAAK
ncbi:MAG: hypothetical protein IPH10_08900 [bacterium]|nr:hypothetical protein [bacterium]